MEFAVANIWQDFKNASGSEQGISDNGNEVVLGPRLNEAVRHWANGYLKRLDLGPENKATTERAKLLDLHWGRIERDGEQLRGLGAALTGFAEVLGANVTTLAERWQGESYNAFKAAMDKVQRTLSEYGTAATTTGEGLVNAMSQVRELYQTFADDSANKHLNFGDVSPPEKWHRIGEDGKYTSEELASCCPSDHGNGLFFDLPDLVDYNYDCIKNNDEQSAMINGHWVTERRWEICKQDGCEESLDRVSIMYTNLVDQCQAAVDRISGKLENYFGAVNTAVDGVSGLFDVALGNVHTLANAEVFSSLRVIGGQPAGGGAPVDSGTPTGDVEYPTGGDTGPAAVAEPMPPEPEPAPVEATAPVDAVAQQPPPEPEPPAAGQAESVQIKDGDRTIGVTSPDGEGHVRVTVEDGTGATKTYELDFDAASGLVAPTLGGTEPSADAEQIPARTDGKCVIQDGPLTITAERPLFSPDSIKLVVDDGSGNPATYTLDFPEQATPDPAEQAAAQPTPGTPATAPTEAPAAAPTGTPAAASTDMPDAGPIGTPGNVSTEAPVTQAPTPGQTPAVQEPVANGSPGPVPAGQLTTPQVWQGDQTGSVSGVLVPDQPSGEAGLAKAPDAAQPEVAGMAGAAGVPMAGGPPSGGSDSGRAGSGWSVHGDLFDSGEPVYSMHGVLGDDERTTE
jgi:hypothetical protein